MNVCYLMRGLPGSGKSTAAAGVVAGLAARGVEVVVCSSDAFFVCPCCGEYRFQLDRLVYAHAWCQERFRKAVEQERAVVVDNTNVSALECQPYVEFAVKHEYEVVFVEPATEWAFDAKELARRNVHGVSEAGIRAMLADWEPDMTVAKALDADVWSHLVRNHPDKVAASRARRMTTSA